MTNELESDLERAAKFLWVRYYAPDEDNDQTEADLIASDGSCAALASVFAAIRAEAVSAEREWCAQTLQALFALADEADDALDKDTYEQKRHDDFDTPDDAEWWIRAGTERKCVKVFP